MSECAAKFGSPITREIWSDIDNLLLVYVGSAAEFALVDENHWLFYTGKLPARPWERFLVTLEYNQKIFRIPADEVPAFAGRIRDIHSKIEAARSRDEGGEQRMSNDSFKSVGAMLIDYGIRGREYLSGCVMTDAEREAYYQDEARFFELMEIREQAADYVSFEKELEHARNTALQVNPHTAALMQSYRRELGLFRYWIMTQFMMHFVPEVITERLGLRPSLLFTPLYRIYSTVRHMGLGKVWRVLLLPKRVRAALNHLDAQLMD